MTGEAGITSPAAKEVIAKMFPGAGVKSINVFKNLRSSVVLAGLSKNGQILTSTVTRKGISKVELLFANRNDAMNWARQQLGNDAVRTFNSKGQWNGWMNKAGDSVYWNHGGWGKGIGKSTYPHLN